VRDASAAALLALAGLAVAAAIGFAAYLASRDSVGLPVTRLEPAPRLAPTVRPRHATTQTGTTTSAVTTVEDRHGGGGGGNSGRGGGGGGDD
jgi:hypothetical protein